MLDINHPMPLPLLSGPIISMQKKKNRNRKQTVKHKSMYFIQTDPHAVTPFPGP